MQSMLQDAQSEGGGSFKAQSEASSGGKNRELTDDQKKLLLKARVVMIIMLAIFIVCSLFEEARLLMCIVLLTLMGIMSCCWEEDQYLASAEGGSFRRVRAVTCQLCMVMIPLSTAGWMAFIAIQIFTREPETVLRPEDLALIPTPPGLAYAGEL